MILSEAPAVTLASVRDPLLPLKGSLTGGFQHLLNELRSLPLPVSLSRSPTAELSPATDLSVLFQTGISPPSIKRKASFSGQGEEPAALAPNLLASALAISPFSPIRPLEGPSGGLFETPARSTLPDTALLPLSGGGTPAEKVTTLLTAGPTMDGMGFHLEKAALSEGPAPSQFTVPNPHLPTRTIEPTNEGALGTAPSQAPSISLDPKDQFLKNALNETMIMKSSAEMKAVCHIQINRQDCAIEVSMKGQELRAQIFTDDPHLSSALGTALQNRSNGSESTLSGLDLSFSSFSNSAYSHHKKNDRVIPLSDTVRVDASDSFTPTTVHRLNESRLINVYA